MWVRESCTTPISGLSRRRIWVITSHIFLTNILCHNCLDHNVCTILHSSNIHWMFLTLPVFVFTRACFYLVFFLVHLYLIYLPSGRVNDFAFDSCDVPLNDDGRQPINNNKNAVQDWLSNCSYRNILLFLIDHHWCLLTFIGTLDR